MKKLFESFQLGNRTLKNRIVMAPMTRSRAGPDRIPNLLMSEYYEQRATAGLILTEATVISPKAVGYPNTPGIWPQAQVEGWKLITKKVHDRGGIIFCQLWHVGRISDPSFLNGETPVAPSAIAPDGMMTLVKPEKKFVTPRALSLTEISGIIADYKRAAENAKAAGFDGVEIHGANGYLPDQFLQSTSNHRTDQYGGSIQNRARFLLEVVDAAISVWGSISVGVHLSPRCDANFIGDANPKETFGYVASELKKREVAFIFLREKQGTDYLTPYLKETFGGTVIANEGLTPELAASLLTHGIADLTSFGMLYISNPDLVERIKQQLPLNKVNPSTIYADGAVGYTDYPSLKAILQ